MKRQALPYEVRLFAGKTDPANSGDWLPLWMHLQDTAGIMQHLVQQWLPENVRQHLGLDEETLTRLACFLVGTELLARWRAGFLGKLLAVTYEGVLQVTDAEAFRALLCQGMGRGKAYGLGLLTVMRGGTNHG